MDYTQIKERELFKRYNALPQNLRDALELPANQKIAQRICVNHHLTDEEKIIMIEQLVGLVLFGFIHADDLKKEINDALELENPKLAASIADEISRKIFSSIRDDLEQNYEPLPEPEIEPGPAPKILSEIKKPVETFSPRPEPPQEEKVAPPPTSPLHSEASPLREQSESFEEKPIILHEEDEFEPGKPSAGFKLETPPPKFEEVGEKFTPPMRPARLEIGGEPVPTPIPPQPRPPTETPRTINYTDLRTPPTPSKPLMSPEQELPAPPSPALRPPYSPPQPAKEVNIRADEIKITIESPPPAPAPTPQGAVPRPASPPTVKPTMTPITIPKPAPRLIPKPEPPPPPAASPTMTPITIPKKGRGFWGWLKSLFGRKPQKEIVFAPKVISKGEPFRLPTAPQPSQPPQPAQRPTRGPSVLEEVVDLSTLTKAKKLFPPPETPES